MQIKEVVSALEHFAPLSLQDGFDNAGMQIGLAETEVTGALLCLDVTEEVIDEAVDKGCNLIVSHHPLLFNGCKKIVGDNLVERCVIKAIRSGVAIYSAHTNLDNAVGGVNFKIAEKLGLEKVRVLDFKPGFDGAGAGVIGELPTALGDKELLLRIKDIFGVGALMHNQLSGRPVKRIALCGGSGAFLLDKAVEEGADLFLTGEMHYHSFFGYEDKIVIAVIGHYESEQFTHEVLKSIIMGEFPELKVITTELSTNPINYL